MEQIVFRNVGIYKSDAGGLPSSQAGAYEDGTDRVFRNVGIYKSEAGELPSSQAGAYEYGTDRVFRNVGIYNSDAGELHGESLKSRFIMLCDELFFSLLTSVHVMFYQPSCHN